MEARRLSGNPIIRPEMHESLGDNVNGPSLIRAPDWLPDPMGRYCLYFAHHGGKFIRLACADGLEGPWTIYGPGALRLDESMFAAHIASPDVHVDDAERRIRMYYHGVGEGGQLTRAATSPDGIHFAPRPEILGRSYFRVFEWDGWHYAIRMSGNMHRSRDPLGGFERGPRLPLISMRHLAVKIAADTLLLFYSRKGDKPERILCSEMDLTPDWRDWKPSRPVTVLEPETEWEGADLPLERSRNGRARGRVRQLRDPAIYEEDGRTYLLYSVAGESGIAIAELLR